MSGQGSGKIYGTRAFGAVKAPNGFRQGRVHVDGFTAVTPAGCNCKGNADAFTFEFFSRCGGFSYSAYAGVGDNAFNLASVGMTKLPGDELGNPFGHAHGLGFE
jgi:hypothetical protein